MPPPKGAKAPNFFYFRNNYIPTIWASSIILVRLSDNKKASPSLFSRRGVRGPLLGIYHLLRVLVVVTGRFAPLSPSFGCF